MELENLNEQYVLIKNNLARLNNEVENLEKGVEYLLEEYVIQNAKRIEAKRSKDNSSEQIAKNRVDKINNKIQTLKEEAINKKQEIKDAQDKINAKINEIKNNPKMQEHINEVLTKKYSRKISKLNEEKKNALIKKEKLNTLQQLIKNHPSLSNNLKGIFIAKKQINDLSNELEGLKNIVNVNGKKEMNYTNVERASKIIEKLLPEARERYNSNKKNLISYISKKGLNILESDIEEVTDKKFCVNGKGEIDITTTLNKEQGSLNRQIKGFDKSINKNVIQLNEIGNLYNNISENKINEENEKSLSIVSQRPKWYEFFKRFKMWNQNRKNNKIKSFDDDEVLKDTDIDKSDDKTNLSDKNVIDNENIFKNSLRYEIVKDAVILKEKENLEDAKAKVKENKHKQQNSTKEI